jgi:hypothetical protein
MLHAGAGLVGLLDERVESLTCSLPISDSTTLGLLRETSCCSSGSASRSNSIVPPTCHVTFATTILLSCQISFLLEPVLLIQVKFVPVPASFPSLTIYSDVLYSHGRLGQFTSGGGTGGFPDSGGGTHPFGQNGGEVEGVGSSGMPLRAGKMGPPPSTGSASREVQEPHP